MSSTFIQISEDHTSTPPQMSEEISPCRRCSHQFSADEDYIQADGHTYCEDCFCCDQCFQEFPDGEYFQHPTFEDKLYCPTCFNMLYAPICAGCGSILESKYKIAMGRKWCMGCLVCSTVRSKKNWSGSEIWSFLRFTE